ncbi:hypothetical protein OGH69_15230 [Flavobacterium sp. MFBS3-15]|uniref:hypothetical protein n=1 Tax=Flavobacterium sp. MFBS3-15 TaxID=2989816 RepID=UPI0022365FA4|nr:hypothetical protein [Flavobacterium sp. MFBS3-15]MCW4470326.1 hypothetical protein [Flavobacterium sp. MFBS3-15]
MARVKYTDVMAVVSCAGMIAWLLTQFFGGMAIWFFSYPLIIFPVLILYIISIFNTLIAIGRKGFGSNRIKIMSHCVVVVLIVASAIFDSDLLRSKRIMTATLYDDLFSYTLVLRQNGSCQNEVNGFMGFSEVFNGQYTIKGDTIIFSKMPYDNEDFIPDTILIDRRAGAIFIERDTTGNFIKEKGFLNHFKIEE